MPSTGRLLLINPSSRLETGLVQQAARSGSEGPQWSSANFRDVVGESLRKFERAEFPRPLPLWVKTSNMQDEQMLSGPHWIPDMQNAPQRAWGVLTIRSRSLLAIFLGERPVRRDEQSQSRFSREIQGRICREWRAPFRKTSMQATTYDQVNRTCRACTQWRLAHAFGHSCRPPLNFDFY
jgi:hypothetical protein